MLTGMIAEIILFFMLVRHFWKHFSNACLPFQEQFFAIFAKLGDFQNHLFDWIQDNFFYQSNRPLIYFKKHLTIQLCLKYNPLINRL
jgi:hypothetical protein